MECEFSLEKWKQDYAENLAFYANNIKIANNLRNTFPNPYTISDAKQYIESYMNDEKNLVRAIVADGQAVGSIGIHPKDDIYEKSAEIGYWLAEPFWGKGIATKAVKMICKTAFKKFDIVRIFAEPFAHNVASRSVLGKSGFELEGIMKKGVFKNNEFFDYCMYALVK